MRHPCAVLDCDRLSVKRSLCDLHYQRARVTGRLDLKTDEERFWSHVDKSGECWIWTASRVPWGYGKTVRNREETYAHRYSWEMAYGPIPDGMLVMHSCDNPPCVNPSHLLLGTPKDNMDDMRAKGRWRPRRVTVA